MREQRETFQVFPAYGHQSKLQLRTRALIQSLPWWMQRENKHNWPQHEIGQGLLLPRSLCKFCRGSRSTRKLINESCRLALDG